MGLVLCQMKKYSEALECYQRVLSILTTGKGTLTCAQTLGNIGIVYVNMEKYDKALEYYQQAAEIQVRVKGREDRDHLMTIENMIAALLL